MENLKSPKQGFFSTLFGWSSKRASRRVFIKWMAVLIPFLFSIVAIHPIISRGGEFREFIWPTWGIILGLLFLVFAISILIIYGNLVIRRCADMDYVQSWFIVTLIPYIWLLFLLFLCFKKWTIGSNRFGPDPLQAGDMALSEMK